MSRLIDADKLCEDLLDRWSIADTRKEELIRRVMADIVTPIIASQPSAEPEIELLKEALERQKQITSKAIAKILELNYSEYPNGWIPCSERMPNENDYRECIECIDGAVWYFTENGAMGLGYYYEFTKEWSTTDDLKTDGKVVAWMPLPEPYRED